MMEVVTAGSMTSNPTTLYSMPSRESMVEIRQDTMQRYGSSPLFNNTASVPISLDDDDEMNTAQSLFEEKRDDSMRSTSSRTDEVRQSLSLTSSPPRTAVSTTTSTPRKKSSQSTPPRNSLLMS
mmetsp:Transcript_540/g.906  ORF Transcript_540/g.906 Transcript_540/m.906 type:complete len:124 (+) Transcript_540:126-497(+)